MKILIIEDEPSLREIMSRVLRQEGYVVESAATYLEADSKVAGYSYDCILLDVMLPDGNGLKLLEHIRNLGKRENVRSLVWSLVLMTTYPNPSIRRNWWHA